MAFVPHTGLFRHPFVFKVVDKTQNPSAGHEEFFRELCSARGYFRQTSGSAKDEDGAYVSVLVYEAYCPWRSVLENNLSQDTRLIYNGKDFRIESFELVNEERKFYRFQLSVATQWQTGI